jgi:hypothetical protein
VRKIKLSITQIVTFGRYSISEPTHMHREEYLGPMKPTAIKTTSTKIIILKTLQ